MNALVFFRFHIRCSLLIAGSLFSGATSLMAQSGGSTYSIFNIGELETATSAAGVGRAGVETALPYSAQINSINPAGWSTLSSVTIKSGLSFKQYKVSNAEQSAWQNRVSIQNLAVGFPFEKSIGGTLVAGVRPFSSVEYKTGGTLDVPNADTNIPVSLVRYGNGGVNEAFAGIAAHPTSWLSVGANASFLFGTSHEISRLTFPVSGFNNGAYVNTNRYSGAGGSFGLIGRPTDNLLIGATITGYSTISRSRTELGLFRENGANDTVSVREREDELSVPLRMTFGASYRAGRLMFAADYLMQNWESQDLAPDARGRTRLAVGLDYLPSTLSTATWTEKWTLRLGAWREQTYVQVDGTGIDEMGLSLGASIPFTGSTVTSSGVGMDLGLALGMRGTTDNGLTKEAFGKLVVGLHISELWFQR